MMYRGEGYVNRITGPRKKHGHCVLEIEPLPSGAGVVFEAAVDATVVHPEFIPYVEQAVRDEEITSGLPFRDMRIRLVGGSWNEIDSCGAAFEEAARMALQNAVPV